MALKKGEALSKDKLAVKRPATGISPMRWHEILESVAKKDYAKDEPI